MDFLDGLDVGEDFLKKAAESQPTVSEFTRRYVLEVDTTSFRKASEKYMQKVADAKGPIIQIVFEGKNADKDKDLTNPPAFTIGSGWELVDAAGGNTSNRVSHDEYTAFSGASGYGKIIAGLNRQWGLSPETEQFFMKMDKETEKEYVLGPEAERFIRWYAKRHKEYPDYTQADIWDGVSFQMDKVTGTNSSGKEYENSAPAGLCALKGETQEEWDWYVNRLESFGIPVPWYAIGPGMELANRPAPDGEEAAPNTGAKSNGKPAPKKEEAKKGTEAKAETKAEAKKEEPKKEDKKAAAPASSSADDDEILSNLTVLASEHSEDPAEFKKQALQMVKGPQNSHWISAVTKAPFHAALLDGTATIPAKKGT